MVLSYNKRERVLKSDVLIKEAMSYCHNRVSVWVSFFKTVIAFLRQSNQVSSSYLVKIFRCHTTAEKIVKQDTNRYRIACYV